MSLGKRDASVDMRQLPLPTHVCDCRLAKLSSLAVCDSFGTGYCAGDNYGCLAFANNLLQSTDKIMALSQSLQWRRELMKFCRLLMLKFSHSVLTV